MDSASPILEKRSGVTGMSRSLSASRVHLRRRLWIWPILAAVMLGGVGWWVHYSVEEAMRQNLADELMTILNADVEALQVWTSDQKAIARSVAESPAVRALVRDLLANNERKEATGASVVQSRALAELRSHLEPSLKNFGFADFYVFSPSFEVVASNYDSPIKSLRLDEGRRSFLQQVSSAGTAVSKPRRALTPMPDTKGELKMGVPRMFVATPIADQNGKPMAVLSLGIRPERQFTDILHTARFADSGETYAVSKEGLLLSQSRFDKDLKRLGLLPDLPDSDSILTVEVRDPQVDMMSGERPSLSRAEQPLTKLAQHAAAGGTGVVMTPYGDYRGVPSIGAWRWLPEYDFAVATEVDVADVYGPLYVLRRAIWLLLGLLALSSGAIFSAMVVVARHQRRAEKAEKKIQQLGQYTLEQQIGAGGMGSVYRARHAFLRRPTAVKMLNTEQVAEGALARFEREVQLTSQLNHPNTISVYDYGRTSEGVFYYAMELVQGINLEELVKEYGPLPEGRAIAILRQVCGSLTEAHGIGLIHRDIKPANIILTVCAGIPDFVKVLDFGLVKAAESDEATKITQANAILGTPHYMAPEAIERPESVSALSDIYAIGAVGYFLVTGTPVFTGKTVMDICMKHVRATPDPPSKRLGRVVHPGLESLLLHCLAKDPKDRPASTKSLEEALASLETGNDWTPKDAEDWWAAFRAKTDAETRARDGVVGPTVVSTATENA
jgi:hypothetical protein